MKLIACMLLVFAMISCDLFSPQGRNLEISVLFGESQNDLQQVDRDSDGTNEWVFPLYFPNATDIAASAGGEIVSTGHALYVYFKGSYPQQ